MSEIFLTPEDVAFMTGRKTASKQIEVLRQMGIPFFVNAAGRPIITKQSIGVGLPTQAAPTITRGWKSRVLKE